MALWILKDQNKLICIKKTCFDKNWTVWNFFYSPDNSIPLTRQVFLLRCDVDLGGRLYLQNSSLLLNASIQNRNNITKEETSGKKHRKNCNWSISLIIDRSNSCDAVFIAGYFNVKTGTVVQKNIYVQGFCAICKNREA